MQRGRRGQRGHADQSRTIVHGFLVRVLDFHIGKHLKRGPFECEERLLADFLCSSCFSKVNIVFSHHLTSFVLCSWNGISSTLVDTACMWWWPLLDQPGRIEKYTSALNDFPSSIFLLAACPRFSCPRFRFSHWAKSNTQTTIPRTKLLCRFALIFLRSLHFA